MSCTFLRDIRRSLWHGAWLSLYHGVWMSLYPGARMSLYHELDVILESSKIVKLGLTWVATTQSDAVK